MVGMTFQRLGNVAEFIRGITFKPEDVVPVGSPGVLGCMRTKNVQEFLDTDDVWGIPAQLMKRQDQLLRVGDLLVSSANSWNLIGKCCVVPELPWPATFGGFISVLRSTSANLDSRYLYRWFSSDRVQATVRSFGQATTNISNLNFERCLKLEIPLPSIEEQRRIADILDRADTLRAKRRAALARLDELTQAIFVEMFGNHRQTPVTIGDRLEKSDHGWSWELLTDFGRLATGHTPDRKRPEYWSGHIPWVTLTDIRKLDGSVAYETSEGVTEEGIENSSAVKLPPGTVCFSRTASVGFVTVMGKEMATSQDFVNWVCGPKLDPIYLMHALLLSRERLRSLSTGSTHKTIYFPTVERFRVLVPPLDRQRSFRAITEKITAIKARCLTTASKSDDFFASLQDRAFRGAL